MFIIQEATLSRHKELRSRLIIAIKQRDLESRSSSYLDNAFRNRELALQFQLEQMRGRLKTVHDEAVLMLDKQVTELGCAFDCRSDSAMHELELSSNQWSMSYASLEHKLSKELFTIRRDFEEKYSTEMRYQREKLTTEVEMLAENRKMLVSEASKASLLHLSRIEQLHLQGESMLQSFFRGIIEDNDETMHDIETKIKALQTEIDNQSCEINRLNDENSVVSRPLNDLDSQRRKLVEKIEEADSGTMAYRNYKNSISLLESKLRNIDEEIKEKQTLLLDSGIMS